MGSDIPELLQWVVFYSLTDSTSGHVVELSMNVSSTSTSVVISGLQANQEYDFAVLAVTMVDGNVTIGERVPATVVEENSELEG